MFQDILLKFLPVFFHFLNILKNIIIFVLLQSKTMFMFSKKPLLMLIVCFAISFILLTACNNSSTSSTSTDTTATQIAAPDSSMQMMQDSSMMDTSKMDTASTRPVRHPN